MEKNIVGGGMRCNDSPFRNLQRFSHLLRQNLFSTPLSERRSIHNRSKYKGVNETYPEHDAFLFSSSSGGPS